VAKETLQKLDEIAAKIAKCGACRLCEGRTLTVPGEGHPQARVLIVGEAPGKNEDEAGRPFVGMAGKFLNRLLGTAGLDRSELFITNVVKCRPPENRAPMRDEIEACADFLQQQIKAINPLLIILLGKTAATAVLGLKSLGEGRGGLIERDGRLYFVAHHPAARFHRAHIAADFELLRDELNKRPDLRSRLKP